MIIIIKRNAYTREKESWIARKFESTIHQPERALNFNHSANKLQSN